MIAKRGSKKLSTVDEARAAAPSTANLRNSPDSQFQPGKSRKKKKSGGNPTGTIKENRNVTAGGIEASSDSKKSVSNPKLKSTRKTNNKSS